MSSQEPSNSYVKAGLLSKLTFWWIRPFIVRGRKTVFTQAMHEAIAPQYDLLLCHKSFLSAFFQRKGLPSLFISQFRLKAFIFAMVFAQIAFQAFQIYLLYNLTRILAQAAAGDPDLPAILLNFLWVVFSQTVLTFVSIWANYLNFNEMVFLKTNFMLLISKKALSISFDGASAALKGNVINLIQNDCEEIQRPASWIFTAVQVALTMVLSIPAGFFFFGLSFAFYLAVTIAFMLACFKFAGLNVQKKRALMSFKDEKMTFLGELFAKAKYVKLNRLEKAFARLVWLFREREVRQLWRVSKVFLAVIFLNYANTVAGVICLIWSYFALYGTMSLETYVSLQRFLTIFEALIKAIPYPLGAVVELGVLFGRIDRFLGRENSVIEDYQTKVKLSELNSVEISSAEIFFQGTSKEKTSDDFPARAIKIDFLQIEGRNLVFVLGFERARVSAFLKAICGEGRATAATRIRNSGSAVYCGSHPFLAAKSIADNIIFYRPYSQRKLERAVKMAKLDSDLFLMGQTTELLLKENGANLPQAVKVKVALARSFYGEDEVLVFDESFAGLGQSTVSEIFQQTFANELRDRTRIVSLNSLDFLNLADRILFFENEGIKVYKDFSEFKASENFRIFKQNSIFDEEKIEKNAERESDPDKNNNVFSEENNQELQEDTPADLFPNSNRPGRRSSFFAEHRLQGRQLWFVFRSVSKYYGGGLFLLFSLALSLLVNFLEYLSNIYLYDAIQAKQATSQTIDQLIGYFSLLLAAPCFIKTALLVVFFRLGMRLSRRIHRDMVARTLRADFARFFLGAPASWLLNRFSADIKTVDDGLTLLVFYLVILAGTVGFDIWLSCALIGWQAVLTSAFYLAAIFALQHTYVRIGKDVFRLEEISKTPVVNFAGELMGGREVIRSLRAEPAALEEMARRVNEHAKNALFRRSLLGWMETWLGILNLFFMNAVPFVVLLVSIFRRDYTYLPVYVSYMFKMTTEVQIFADLLSAVETSFIAIERCEHFHSLPKEKDLGLVVRARKSEAPELGSRQGIFVRELFVRYPGAEKYAVAGFSGYFRERERVMVLGKTGSGKSTLIKALTGLLPIETGAIFVSEENISDWEVKMLRKKILVVDSEVVIFKGTVLENLLLRPNFQNKKKVRKTKGVSGKIKERPKENGLLEHLIEETGEDKKSLTKDKEDLLVRKMKEFGFSEEKLEKQGLQFDLESTGSNLTLVEKQLINIFKIFLTDKKIIVLDEAVNLFEQSIAEKMLDFIFELSENKIIIVFSKNPIALEMFDVVLAINFSGAVSQKCEKRDFIGRENDYQSKLNELSKEFLQKKRRETNG